MTQANDTTQIALTTATGTAAAPFGWITDLAPRKGFIDAMQDRYRVRGTNAGVEVEQTDRRTMYFLRPQAKFAVFPGSITFVVFDPANVLRTQVEPPARESQSVYDDGPLLDYFHSREFQSMRRRKLKGWI